MDVCSVLGAGCCSSAFVRVTFSTVSCKKSVAQSLALGVTTLEVTRRLGKLNVGAVVFDTVVKVKTNSLGLDQTGWVLPEAQPVRIGWRRENLIWISLTPAQASKRSLPAQLFLKRPYYRSLDITGIR